MHWTHLEKGTIWLTTEFPVVLIRTGLLMSLISNITGPVLCEVAKYKVKPSDDALTLVTEPILVTELISLKLSVF